MPNLGKLPSVPLSRQLAALSARLLSGRIPKDTLLGIFPEVLVRVHQLSVSSISNMIHNLCCGAGVS